MGRGRESAGTALRWQLLTGAVAAALYLQSAGFGWVFDDQLEVVHNALIRSPATLPHLFTSTAWAGTGMETYLYRPLTLLTHALNFQLSGLHPWSYHLANIFLHAGVSVLVFRLGLLWKLPVAAAGVGGLLFAVHPVHVEVAAAVFGRKDLLAALFVLAMVLAHRAAVRPGEGWHAPGGGWRLALPPAAFAAALLSKEVGAAGLLLVAAHDLVLEPDRRGFLQRGRVAGLYVAYLGVLLLYLLARGQVAGGLAVPETSFFDNPLVGATLLVRLATALVVVGKGLALLALPLTLSPDYSYNAIPLVASPLDLRLLGAGALLGALLLLALHAGRLRRSVPGGPAAEGWGAPAILLGLAWYALTLLPASNLPVLVGTIFGERLLYLPSVAFCLLAGAALHALRVPSPRGGSWVAALIILAFSAQTLRYSRAWRDDLSLFRWAVASVPASTKAHHKLGEELLREGELGDALRALDRALVIAPHNEFAAHTMALARRQAAESAPSTQDPDILFVLGQTRREEEDFEGAEAYWKRALELHPAHPETLAELALLRLLEGDTATALSSLKQAVAEKPSLAGAWFNLGHLSLARGEVGTAREALGRFVELAGTRFPEQLRWARRVLEDPGLR